MNPTSHSSRSSANQAVLAPVFALCMGALFGGPAWAQPAPEQDGLRFNRFAAKRPETLAQKPGGPTERIEIQSTDDHIDYVVKTYVLKEANASEVFELIQQAVALEGGKVSRISKGSVVETMETDQEGLQCKRTYSGDSMLVVTVPDWMIPYLDQTIKALDRKDLESVAYGTGVIFAKIKHRLPSEVAEMIRDSSASPSIVLKPDDTRQILYIEDTPSFFTCDLEALKTFDAPPPQIETRVRIHEINEEDSRDVGLDWQAWKKSIDHGYLTFRHNPIPAAAEELDLQSLSAELSFTPELATEFLNYLTTRGHAKVITDSRLTQINNQQAIVRSVTQLPYVVRGFVGDNVADSPLRDSPEALTPDRLIKEFTEGVVVTMTPRIGTEIELAVNATVSSHVGYTPNQSVPLMTDSQVNTVVLLEPNKAAVLGGLSRESRVTERSGVVGLKDVPGLKWLFSREVERRHKSQIIITIELDRVVPGDPAKVETVKAAPPAKS